MLFRVFRGSLGNVFGAPGSFLRGLLSLLGAPSGTPKPQKFCLGTHEPRSCLPRNAQQPQTAPQAPSWRGRWPHEATKAHLETYVDLSHCDIGGDIEATNEARDIALALQNDDRLSSYVLIVLS